MNKCAEWGNHVWTYPGRKWPYDGQPCICGEKIFSWERLREKKRLRLRGGSVQEDAISGSTAAPENHG
jgi:hypothetical protein